MIWRKVIFMVESQCYTCSPVSGLILWKQQALRANRKWHHRRTKYMYMWQKLFHPTFDTSSWEFVWGQHVLVNNISLINLIVVTVDFSCKGINKQGWAMKLGVSSESSRYTFSFTETVFVNLKLTYNYTEDICFQKRLLLQCYWLQVSSKVYGVNLKCHSGRSVWCRTLFTVSVIAKYASIILTKNYNYLLCKLTAYMIVVSKTSSLQIPNRFYPV